MRERTKWVETDQNPDSDEEPGQEFTIYHIDQKSIRVELQLNGKPFTLEVDTGAAVSIVSEQKMKKILPRVKTQKTRVALRTNTSGIIIGVN